MSSPLVSMQAQLNGKYVKEISVPSDASKTMIENAAFKATDTTRLQAKVTIVPGRIANVIRS